MAELRTQLQIVHEIGYIEKTIFDRLESECVELGKMIGKLIKVRQGITTGDNDRQWAMGERPKMKGDNDGRQLQAMGDGR